MNVDEDLLEQLRAVAFAFRSEMRRGLQDAGYALNGMQVHMFLQLAREGGATASALVQGSGRDKAQVTRLVQQLEQAALVRREPDPDDRRVQRLYLTEAGQQLHGHLQCQRQAVGARLLGKLSAQEQAQLAGLLARIRPD